MKVFGHRGSPGFPRFAENTLASFRKALSAGADGFELDVRRCADDTIVVIHDATLDRTTNGSGRVRAFSYQELSEFDAGYGDPIPRLSDILQEFGARSTTIHLELKEGGLARDVAAMVMDEGPSSEVVLSAFDSDDNDRSSNSSWADLRSVSATVSTALLVTRRKLSRIGSGAFVRAAEQYNARGLHIPRNGIPADLMTLARQAELPVRVWTVNDPNEAMNLRDAGVDAIFSDNPARCIRALAR